MTLLVVLSVISMVAGSLAFRTTGTSKTIFHDVLSKNFSISICEESDQLFPESVQVENRFENYSLTVGLNNTGYEYLVNNNTIGFGIYPSNSSEIVIIQGWDLLAGELVTLKLDLTSGNISDVHIESQLKRVVSMCPADNMDTVVAKRGLAETAANLLRGACRSLLSPIAWTNCRIRKAAICTSVSLSLEAAIPIPGDSVIWYWACQGALTYVCGQLGKADPTSAEVCQAMERYIKDKASSIFG